MTGLRYGRRLVPGVFAVVVPVLAFGFGALVADPVGSARAIGERWLLFRGARREFFTAKDGTRLHAMVLGPLSAEPPVVLLHGLGASGDYFAEVAPTLRSLGLTVVIPDAPGSGASQPPVSPAGYGLSNRMAAVASLVQAMGLSTVDLVGHSLGGLTAAHYALLYPQHVGRLVLVDAAGFTRPPKGGVEEMRAELSPADRAGAQRLLSLLFFRPPSSAGFVVAGLARQYNMVGVRQTIAALGPPDWLLEREHELPRGTVLIWGEKETLFPVEDARRTRTRMVDGRLLVITGVGHDGPLEAPRAFREALLRALGKT